MLPDTVSRETKKQRLLICYACEHYKSSICTLCGCFVRLKTELKKAQCPANPPKWTSSEV